MLLSTWSAAGLTMMLGNELDMVLCRGCGTPLDVMPSAAAAFDDPPGLVVLIGTLMQEHVDKFAELLLDAWPPAITWSSKDQARSVDEFRRKVIVKLRPHISRAQEVLRTSPPDLELYVAEHWRDLTPTVFAVGRLLADPSHPLHVFMRLLSVGDGREARISPVPESREHQLASAQAHSWMALVRCNRAVTGPPLEEDLRRYIRPGEVTAEAAHLFSGLAEAAEDVSQASLDWRLVTELDTAELKLALDRYALHAVTADVFTAARLDNPCLDGWLRSYLTLELTVRTHDQRADLHAILPYRVSPQGARPSADRAGVLSCVARFLSARPSLSNDRQQIGALRRAAADLGYADLVDEALGFPSSAMIDDTLGENKEDLGRIQAVVASAASDEELMFSLHVAANALPASRRPEDIERLARIALAVASEDTDMRARIELWATECLLEIGVPLRALDRLGSEASEWENEVPVASRFLLGVRRAEILIARGARFTARRILEEALGDFGSVTAIAQKHYGRCLAALQREEGAPDMALGILAPLMSGAPPYLKASLLSEQARAYSALGQYDRAAASLDTALALVGPAHRQAPMLTAQRAHCLVRAERLPLAVEILETLSGGPVMPPMAFAVAAEAWIDLRLKDPRLVPGDRVMELWDALNSLVRIWRSYHDSVAARCVWLLAFIGEATGVPGAARDFWELALKISRSLRDSDDPDALAWLAMHAYEAGDSDKGRALLIRLPRALLPRIGGISSVSEAVFALIRLRAPLSRALESLLSAAERQHDDIRLANELMRDAIARVRGLFGWTIPQAIDEQLTDMERAGNQVSDQVRESIALTKGAVRRASIAGLEEGIGTEVMERLASLTPDPFVVIDWCQGANPSAIITRLSQGGIENRYLTFGTHQVADINARLQARLAAWVEGRRGDPLDFPPWRRLADLVVEALHSLLHGGEHVVLLDCASTSGLPWHTAIGPYWSSSYSPSWTALLELLDQRQPPAIALGQLMIPKVGEGARILEAFEDSWGATMAMAAENGIEALSFRGNDADKEALFRLFRQCGIVKLACHGFTDPHDQEVALMLAHDGHLPLTLQVAAASEIGREHWLRWQDCQALERSPRIVALAACSAGVSHVAGLGERLGIFGALRRSGTRAMIAPRWKVPAHVVVPLVDATIALYLKRGNSLGRCLQEVSLAAEGTPHWLSWSLALEGDWR